VFLLEGSDAFSDLDRLNGALDFAGSTEDAVGLPYGIRLPSIEQFMVAVILLTACFSVRFPGRFVPIEDVDGANADADSIGDADVKVHAHRGAVDHEVLAHSFLLQNLVSFVLFRNLPSARE